MKEISYKELTELAEGSYVLVDIRNEGSLKYGMIPNHMQDIRRYGGRVG